MIISLTYDQLLKSLEQKETISNIEMRPLASAVAEDKNIQSILKKIDLFFREKEAKHICSEDLKTLIRISTAIEKWISEGEKNVFDVAACCNVLPDKKGESLLSAYSWGVVADLCLSAKRLDWPITNTQKFIKEKYFEITFQNSIYYAIKNLLSEKEERLYRWDFSSFKNKVKITKRGLEIAKAIRKRIYPELIKEEQKK